MIHPFIWARKSPLKYIVLTMLRDKPKTGMDIIKELEKITFGLWRPSPGTIYPLLKILEEDGFVVHEKKDGRKIYSLTPKGEEVAKEVSIFLPATTLDNIVERMEAYTDYLQDYVAVKGPLPKAIKKRLLSIIASLEEAVEV